MCTRSRSTHIPTRSFINTYFLIFSSDRSIKILRQYRYLYNTCSCGGHESRLHCVRQTPTEGLTCRTRCIPKIYKKCVNVKNNHEPRGPVETRFFNVRALIQTTRQDNVFISIHARNAFVRSKFFLFIRVQ